MSKQFWEDRWNTNQIGWDLGEVSPPLKNYVNQLNNKSIQILIPGCGNAYEAEYLHQNGFLNVFIVEIAIGAIESFKKRYPTFPSENIIHSNFFDLTMQFDLIIEQTFFCALNPKMRVDYVKQMTNLLKTDGKLVGLLFNTDFVDGPPFGGNKNEYLDLFSNQFELKTIETCTNSITPRQGKELFVIFKKM